VAYALTLPKSDFWATPARPAPSTQFRVSRRHRIIPRGISRYIMTVMIVLSTSIQDLVRQYTGKHAKSSWSG
jgi:hypothetical protein